MIENTGSRGHDEISHHTEIEIVDGPRDTNEDLDVHKDVDNFEYVPANKMD